MPAPSVTEDYRIFIRFAALFEASLVIVAIIWGYLAGVKPDLSMPALAAVAIGIAATAPMIGLYALASALPLKSLRHIHDLLLETLGRPLSQCRWHELLLLAATAGICEEILFRGVIEPWFSQWGAPVGWIGTNLLFGAAHAVSPMYFLLAALIGGYLSATQYVAGSLYAPIIAHTLYDWFAFTQLARDYRQRERGDEGAGEAGDREVRNEESRVTDE